MREHDGGSLVHVGSKAGIVGEPGHAAYSASKGAVIALTRAMAVEPAPYKIRVNAVHPGPVLTEVLTADAPSEDDRKRLARETPLGRIESPEEVAEAVLYFSAPESD